MGSQINGEEEGRAAREASEHSGRLHQQGQLGRLLQDPNLRRAFRVVRRLVPPPGPSHLPPTSRLAAGGSDSGPRLRELEALRAPLRRRLHKHHQCRLLQGRHLRHAAPQRSPPARHALARHGHHQNAGSASQFLANTGFLL